MDINDILALPAADKKTQLRHEVADWLPQHDQAIRQATGKPWGHMKNNMTVNDMIGLVTEIHASADPTSWLNTYMGGVTATETESGKLPYLEKLDATEMLQVMLRVAYLVGMSTEVTDHDTVIDAIRQTHRIHSSFEPAMASAMLLFQDYELDGSEGCHEYVTALEEVVLRAFDYLKEPEKTPSTTPTMKEPDAQTKTMLDAVLSSQGLPLISDLYAGAKSAVALQQEVTELTSKLKKSAMMSSATPMTPVPTHTATGSHAIPNGRLVMRQAYDVFKVGKARFDFPVQTWEWDSPNPNVPDQDPHYIFRPEELYRVLYAIMTNQRAYLYGHTGTGKTTLVEQVAAYLMWMFKRINFDSEISRFDLIGRETLTTDASGSTVSKFVDGILPQMMSAPYIGCFDEIDFCRADTAYVMQSALEGNGLVITEDGGRIVNPHSHFRMFATGNTQGQGDETGMYQGARPQSMAFLDRFQIWGKINYLEAKDRRKLVERKVPELDKAQVSVICDYVKEHLEAFKSAKVMQPISPRGMISLGKAVACFTHMDTNKDEALKRAFSTTITDRATEQDRAVLRGIVDRVVK